VTGYECSLDGAGFASCASPVDLVSLAVGAHTFRVRARDGAGTVDATPASRKWTVLASPPTEEKPKPTTGGGSTGGGAGGGSTGAGAAVEVVNTTISTRSDAFKRYTIFHRLTLNGVPAGAKVTVTCKGKKCPAKRFSSTRKGALKLKKFTKKKLRVGVKLTIRVTKDGAIGKQFVITIRKHKKPTLKITQIR
jgi:hypothetical protein